MLINIMDPTAHKNADIRAELAMEQLRCCRLCPRRCGPSHQVYFSGCNLRCEFCAVAEWNEYPQEAESIDIEVLAQRIADRMSEGANNLNLLGGEPAVNIYGILKLLVRFVLSSTQTCIIVSR